MNDVDVSGAQLPWVIVGCGRVGTALAYLAEQLGIVVIAAWDRDGPPDVEAAHRLSGALDSLKPHAQGAAVFLTVSDGAISSVAAGMLPWLNDAEVVVHCSGSLPSTLLTRAGVTTSVASVHPLLAVADSREAVRQFPAAAWTVEGDSPAVWWARGWLAHIDVEPTSIRPDRKALYHASAVASAGLVVAVMDLAFELAESAGMTPERSRSMLLPLARSTLANLETMTTRDALTGPVARDDDQTVRAHLAAMRSVLEEGTVSLYEALTERSRNLKSGE